MSVSNGKKMTVSGVTVETASEPQSLKLMCEQLQQVWRIVNTLKVLCRREPFGVANNPHAFMDKSRGGIWKDTDGVEHQVLGLGEEFDGFLHLALSLGLWSQQNRLKDHMDQAFRTFVEKQ